MGIRSFNLRRAFAFGLVVGAASLAPNPRSADAAITLSIQGPLFSLPISSASPFAQAGSTGNDLTIDTSTLNTYLAAAGSGYTFSTLSATSNSPGGANALLSVTGEALLSGPGSSTITISVADPSFTTPGGADNLFSTSTAIFTSTALGNTQLVNGTGAGVSTAPLSFTSTGPIPNSYSATTPIASVSATPPYSLTESVALSLTSGKDQFAATAIVGPNLPEPSAAGLLLTSAALLARRRRTAR